MPELIAPTAHLHTSWLEAHAEWGPGIHEDGFGLLPTDAVDSLAGFEVWVARLAGESERAGIGGVRCRYRWIVEADHVFGGIALRYGSGELLNQVGHIGYGLRPSARGRGLATWALGRMLDDAHGLGMGGVLLVCAADNVASIKTIERHGGVLESIQDTELGTVRRYWIKVVGECGTMSR